MTAMATAVLQKGFNRLVDATNRQNFEPFFIAGAIPVLGVIPSALSAIYATARIVDRCAVYALKLITTGYEKLSSTLSAERLREIKNDLSEAQRNVVDFCILSIANFVSACTLGFSTLYAASSVISNIKASYEDRELQYDGRDYTDWAEDGQFEC